MDPKQDKAEGRAMIPEFQNEAKPGNPVTSLEMHTKDGTSLHFRFDLPIQKSRMMMALGELLVEIGQAEKASPENPALGATDIPTPYDQWLANNEGNPVHPEITRLQRGWRLGYWEGHRQRHES